MKRLFFASCVFLLSSICAFAQTPSRAAAPPPETVKDDGEVVKITTNLIQLDVVVTGKNDRQITDLKPEDFEILENGKKQVIANFSYVAVAPKDAVVATKSQTRSNEIGAAPPAPAAQLKPAQVRRTIALVVDDLGLSFQSMIQVRAALKNFVDGQMQPGDLVAIVRTSGGMGATQQFTGSKQQLYAAIERIRWYPLGRAGANASFVTAEQMASETQSQMDSFTTGTIGALNYVITGMRELPGRKSIVLLSEGMPLASREDENINDAENEMLKAIRFLTDLANRASVVINTVDARGLSVSVNNQVSIGEAQSMAEVVQPVHSQINTREELISIADQTGGRAFYNNNDIKGSIEKILDDQTGYYLIAYQPDESTFDPAASDRFNKLEVRVTAARPDLKARYRSGFYGVVDKDLAPPPTDPTVPEQLMKALVSPFGATGVNLRLNSLFTNDAKNGSFIRSLLYVEAKDLKFVDEPNGDKKAVFDVVAYTFDLNGNATDGFNENYEMIVKQDSFRQLLDKGFVYRINLPIKKPGAYLVRVALRDAQEEGGSIGTVSQFVQVPDLKKGFLSLSGIVLQGLTKEQIQQIAREQSLTIEKKRPDAIDPETDTALRRFRLGSYLQYAYTIFNARSDAAAGRQPELETQLRIFQDGKLVLEGKAQPVEAKGQADPERIKFNGALALPQSLGPGNYVLQIVVRDRLAEAKRQLATQSIDFEIIK